VNRKPGVRILTRLRSSAMTVLYFPATAPVTTNLAVGRRQLQPRQPDGGRIAICECGRRRFREDEAPPNYR